jgi:hypothetical protein
MEAVSKAWQVLPRKSSWLRSSDPENALSVFPQFALRADISIKSDAFDPEFLAQLGNGSVALSHGDLRQTGSVARVRFQTD